MMLWVLRLTLTHLTYETGKKTRRDKNTEQIDKNKTEDKWLFHISRIVHSIWFASRTHFALAQCDSPMCRLCDVRGANTKLIGSNTDIADTDETIDRSIGHASTSAYTIRMSHHYLQRSVRHRTQLTASRNKISFCCFRDAWAFHFKIHKVDDLIDFNWLESGSAKPCISLNRFYLICIFSI